MTDEEKIIEEHLIMLTEDPFFPEPREAKFELREYDGASKIAFLWVDENFSEEHRVYIMERLRPFITRKLVMGIIRAPLRFTKVVREVPKRAHL
jgi:hypothetical protein